MAWKKNPQKRVLFLLQQLHTFGQHWKRYFKRKTPNKNKRKERKHQKNLTQGTQVLKKEFKN